MKTKIETNTNRESSIGYYDYCIWKDGKFLVEDDKQFPAWTDDLLNSNITLFRDVDRAQFHIAEYETQWDCKLKKDVPGKLSGARVRKYALTITKTVSVGEFVDVKYEDVKTCKSKRKKK